MRSMNRANEYRYYFSFAGFYYGKACLGSFAILA